MAFGFGNSSPMRLQRAVYKFSLNAFIGVPGPKNIAGILSGIIRLGRKGLYEFSLPLAANWNPIETRLRKYKNRPISLADASLIRCAEIYKEARILTFDSDFQIYRWARNNKFEILSV